MTLSSCQSMARKTKGAAAIELAIVLPVFLVFIFGMVEIGRAFMVQHLLSEASRMGARQAIVEGASNSEIKNTVATFCANTLRTDKKSIGIEIKVIKSANQETKKDITDASSGDMCSVTVTIPFEKVSFLPAQFLKKFQLSNTSLMERE